MHSPRFAAPTALVMVSLLSGAVAQSSSSEVVPGSTNPFLAGQPAGTAVKGDTAPAQSPVEASITVCGGATLQFTNVAGWTNYGPASSGFPAEGNAQMVISTPALGISGFNRFPASALVGVFLSNATNSGAAPPDLDFGTSARRDFATLSPELFQTFFIGDGLRNDGTTVQDFVVPAGASRLFLGTVDGSGWYNNAGQLTLVVQVAGTGGILAATTNLGPGCGQFAGAVTSTPPVVCSDVVFGLQGAAPNAGGALLVSLPPVASIPFGAGCLLHLDPATVATLAPLATNASGSWSLLLANIPANFAGAQIALQAITLPTTGSLGLDLSRGLLVTFGS